MQRLGTLAVVMVVGMAGTGHAARLGAEQAAPAAQSAAVAKEVAGLMAKANKECVVVERNAVFGGYVAGFLVPGAKLTVVTARCKDTTAMVYKLYNKDCMGAYQDLSAAID